MKENVKIHSVTPATGWYAVYLGLDAEGNWRKERIACWAAVEYQESVFHNGKWGTDEETYAYVVGMVAGDGSLELANDWLGDETLAYFHIDDFDDTAQQEIRQIGAELYLTNQRLKEREKVSP